MADWKPCAATPSDSETSPTTESAHYCTVAHSTNSSMHSELRRAGLEAAITAARTEER